MNNFFITGLPRSRTAWFARYFTDAGVLCFHEAMKGVCDRDEYWQKMSNPDYRFIGNSDCGLYLGGYREGSPLIVIERDIDEVEESLRLIGIFGVRSVLEEGRDAIERMDGLHILFEDIDVRLEEIHQYCVDTPFSEPRAKDYINMNIQLHEIVPDVESIRVWS